MSFKVTNVVTIESSCMSCY